MRIFLMFLITTILLTGCNEKSNSKNETANSNSTKSTEVQTNTEKETTDIQPEEKDTEPTKVSVDVYPNESKMSKDIDSIGGNVITFNETQSYTLTTSTVTIDKASKNEKSLVVYCTAKQESEEFTAANKYVLTYNFYEIGGWILDDCILEEINMTPNSLCPKDLAYQSLHDLFGFTHCEFLSSEKLNETECVLSYRGYIEYSYCNKIFDCLVKCTYDNEWGWSCYPDYEDISFDFSKIYGNWYCEDPTYTNSECKEKKCWLNVINIDMENETAIFSIEISHGSLYVAPVEITGFIFKNDIDEIEKYGRPNYYVELVLPQELIGPYYENTLYIQFDENYGVKAIEYGSSWMTGVKVN